MDPQKITWGAECKVGDIVASNYLRFRAGQNGLGIAIQLIATRTPGAPVLDAAGHFIGFISEFDILKALQAGKDLHKLKAEDLMVTDRQAITASTTIGEAVTLMEQHRFLNLPVERDGVVIGCVTRHDLLRAWVGIGLGLELEGHP
ncbi:MAG: CBS domain-containing protein [Nitrospirae bacterium]|nr:MAG: CBS domain-containing protein [Nitrospirota bacterium]